MTAEDSWTGGEPPPHLKDFQALLAELNRESERGKVLVAAAMLDDQLARIIVARLADGRAAKSLLQGFSAPLGTFSARIAAASALGVVSQREYEELETIRKIRNLFAHRLGISFEDPAIRDRTKSLSFAAQDYGEVVVNSAGRFTTAAVALILNFTNRAHYVSAKRLAFEEWPY